MSTTSLPSKHRAVVATSDKSVRVDEKALPKLGDDDVLLQVKAVTLNPTDWKHPYGGGLAEGASCGSDYAGIVVKPAAQWKAGDRVAGFTRGGKIDKDNGAFAEYAKSPSALLWKIPESTSFEEAAAMGGIGSHTAIYALEKLGLPRWDKPAQEPIPVLIWSGATSVGHYAVQLAKILNLKAYVTASPKWHDELKKLGAHECFDYKDPKVAEKIKKASGGSIKYGFDTISEKGSASSAAKAFGDEGGKLALLLPYEKQSNDPEKVQFMPILIYNAIDGNDQEGYKLLEAFNKDLPGLIEQGKFKSNPIKKMGNSLEQIKEGLDYLKDGKASGEKLAYTF